MNSKLVQLISVCICCCIQPTIAYCQGSSKRVELEKELVKFSRTLELQGNRLELLSTFDVKPTKLKDKTTLLINRKSAGEARKFNERLFGDDPVAKSLGETILFDNRRVSAFRIPERGHESVTSTPYSEWAGPLNLGEISLFMGSILFGNGSKKLNDLVVELKKCKKVKIVAGMERACSVEYELEDKNKIEFKFEKNRLVSFHYLRIYPPEITKKTRRIKSQKNYSGFTFSNDGKRLNAFYMSEKAQYSDGRSIDHDGTYQLIKEEQSDETVNGRFSFMAIADGTRVFVQDEPGVRFEYQDGKIINVPDEN